MIRFQICIFDILNTAFVGSLVRTACCDSLSNLYLWHIKYSPPVCTCRCGQVVIRFQICIFDILNTACIWLIWIDDCCDSLSNLYLWHIKYSKHLYHRACTYVVIRFQICIFDILNTATWHITRCTVRCDSLSNLYLWHIKYSGLLLLYPRVPVVIRFQICIFDILNTAIRGKTVPACMLWFAFKFVSLTY